MKKIIICFIEVLFCISSFYAQSGKGIISGIILGKNSHIPVEYATIALRDSHSHQIISGVVADSIGYFKLSNVKYGSYDILCSFIGFNDYISTPFILSSKRTSIHFKEILLDDSNHVLKEVIVTGDRSTYMQTIDKKIFNVVSDLMSTSGAISDLLQNVPSIQVDIDGEVSLRGNSNVQILIDGKPSVMMRGTNRGTVLQQIPASSIERIEVITNPSAQFKPDGTSGIINLITKKNHPIGIDGSIQANIGNNGRYNGALSVGWSSSNFNINLSYGYRADRRDRWTDNDRILIDYSTQNITNIFQKTVSKAPSHSHIGGLSFQWDISPKDRIETSGNFTYMTFPRNEDNKMVEYNEGNIIKDYIRHRFDNERQKEGEASFAYTHTFGKDNLLTLDYTYAMQDEVEDNHYNNSYLIPSLPISADNTLIKQANYENLIRLIYSNRINDHDKIVAGYEAELDKSDMRYLAEDLIDNNWIKNKDKSNDFLFYEQVHSLYSTWEHNFNSFSFMAGVRAEQSFIKSKLFTLSSIVNNNYFMFYPSLHTTYSLNEHNEFQFNYSLRVNRPEGDDLNPFPEYQDPYNLQKGNPYLKPEKIHSIEIGWQYKSGPLIFIFTPYFHYTFNKITQISRILEGGVIETSKENMSSSKATGIEAIFNSSFLSWCNFNINSNLFLNTIDASDFGYSSNKSAIAWHLAANANFIPFRNSMLQFNARYNSSQLTPQGKKESSYIINLGARYDLSKYNLSFSATCSDLFDSYKSILIIHTPTIQQRLQKRRAPRIFYLGVNYRFGINKNKSSNLQYDETL